MRLVSSLIAQHKTNNKPYIGDAAPYQSGNRKKNYWTGCGGQSGSL